MKDDQQNTQVSSARKRGPKPFPVRTLEEVLPIAKTILEEGISGKLRRLTVFDRLDRSPDSGPSRQMVIASSRYGLTTGGTGAETLALTDAGMKIVTQAPDFRSEQQSAFDCAIGKFSPFQQLYEKLKNRRVPANDVLVGEMQQLGVDLPDCGPAVNIFLANIRFIGLVQEVSGSEHIIPIEQVLEETENIVENEPLGTGSPLPSTDALTVTQPAERQERSGPSLHIDVQIHIDSSASSDQIDQIFASMAKHLYGKEV